MSDRVKCHYCNALLHKSFVGDHFPLPKRYGGTATVPACRACHDMKDLFPLDVWPDEWVRVVMQEMPSLSRETRIFLAKAVGMLADDLAAVPGSGVAYIHPDDRS